MNTRLLTIVGLFFVIAFSAPFVAMAQSVCNGPFTSCTTASGAPGTCDDTNTCQPNSGQTTGGANSGQSTGGVNTGTTLINPLQGGTNLQTFLQDILQFVVRIGAIVVVFMLIFVGYKFVAAQGEPGAIADARRMLLWTVIGALVLLGAQAIALGIQATVNAISAGQ